LAGWRSLLEVLEGCGSVLLLVAGPFLLDAFDFFPELVGPDSCVGLFGEVILLELVPKLRRLFFGEVDLVEPFFRPHVLWCDGRAEVELRRCPGLNFFPVVGVA